MTLRVRLTLKHLKDPKRISQLAQETVLDV